MVALVIVCFVAIVVVLTLNIMVVAEAAVIVALLFHLTIGGGVDSAG